MFNPSPQGQRGCSKIRFRAQLSQIASHAGTDTERMVKDAALRLLEQDARFRAAVREGIAQADREEFIEEEEMDARIERMLNS